MACWLDGIVAAVDADARTKGGIASTPVVVVPLGDSLQNVVHGQFSDPKATMRWRCAYLLGQTNDRLMSQNTSWRWLLDRELIEEMSVKGVESLPHPLVLLRFLVLWDVPLEEDAMSI